MLLTPTRSLLAALAASLVVAAPASAASPKVTDVDGAWLGTDATAQYVTFVVHSTRATKVKFRWADHGSATARVKEGVSTIVFAASGAKSYRVSVAGCRGGDCAKFKRFSGKFVMGAPVEVPTAPPVTVPAGEAVPDSGPLLQDLPELPHAPPLGTITPPDVIPNPLAIPVPQLPDLPVVDPGA